MTISNISKTQPMREGEIDTIDAVNSLINKINNIGAVLWDGTWSKGETKTVDNLSNYCVFGLKFTGQATYLIGFSPSNATSLRLIGGNVSSTPVIFQYSASFDRTGDSLKYIAGGSINVASTSITPYTVEKIFGII